MLKINIKKEEYKMSRKKIFWDVNFCIVIYLLSGCATTQEILLKPEASRIEFANREPNSDQYKYLGELKGEAQASDLRIATTNARNDIKNKAYSISADVVVIDTIRAAHKKVVVAGRAFIIKK